MKSRLISQFAGRVSTRSHMSLVLLATFCSGILASKIFLWAGLEVPALRYAAAVTLAYGLFFLLIYLWLRLHFERSDEHAVDGEDVVDGVELIAEDAEGSPWIGSKRSTIDVGDFDEGLVLVLFIGLIIAIIGSAGYLIYQAPEIMFEAAAEAMLVGTLSRKRRQLESNAWAVSILKSTWISFLIVFVLSTAFGFAIQHKCPGAISFAEFRNRCEI